MTESNFFNKRTTKKIKLLQIQSELEHFQIYLYVKLKKLIKGSTHTQAARRQSASNISMKGDHTNRDLLAFMPQFLYGQTKRDLNVVNAFAITLHLCNEKVSVIFIR